MALITSVFCCQAMSAFCLDAAIGIVVVFVTSITMITACLAVI